MTGFGSGQAVGEIGSISIEIRSVNSRYLDLQFRMPDELRMAEMPLRELITQSIARGKLELRASYSRLAQDLPSTMPASLLTQIDSTYQHLRQTLPYISAPTFQDVMQWSSTDKVATDPMQWVALCVQAGKHAISQLQQTREREGARLADIIDTQAKQAQDIVAGLLSNLPAISNAQSVRIASRMREAFEQACPDGLSHISAQEISERIAAEASVFSLRADVAEELDRLSLHLVELRDTLSPNAPANALKSLGKRLDFLFQEMNREANTLGSKAVHMDLTRAAIDLKLLIEQMREQIQNIQ
jgi:uncharacterized protein (TIGR00255 family)